MIRYRIIITLIWWVLGLALFFAFLRLTFTAGVFAPDLRDQAIDWLLPNIVPTMTLTGAVAYSAPRGGGGAGEGEKVPANVRFLFGFACVLSLIYLGLVFTAVATSVSATYESERGVLDALSAWNKTLGIFQGFAASAIGVFFVRN